MVRRGVPTAISTGMDYPTALASRRSNLAGTPAWARRILFDSTPQALSQSCAYVFDLDFMVGLLPEHSSILSTNDEAMILEAQFLDRLRCLGRSCVHVLCFDSAREFFHEPAHGRLDLRANGSARQVVVRHLELLRLRDFGGDRESTQHRRCNKKHLNRLFRDLHQRSSHRSRRPSLLAPPSCAAAEQLTIFRNALASLSCQCCLPSLLYAAAPDP